MCKWGGYFIDKIKCLVMIRSKVLVESIIEHSIKCVVDVSFSLKEEGTKGR